jgi:hypothetical protein
MNSLGGQISLTGSRHGTALPLIAAEDPYPEYKARSSEIDRLTPRFAGRGLDRQVDSAPVIDAGQITTHSVDSNSIIQLHTSLGIMRKKPHKPEVAN